MHSVWKSFYHQALLGSSTRRSLPIVANQTNKFLNIAQRQFAGQELEVKKKEETEIDIDALRKKVGIDTQFSEQKHAYVLAFPWNFPEIINDFESEHRPLPSSSFWHKFVFNSANIVDFNHLYREFHQYTAMPDYIGLKKVCEGRLAEYVNESIKRIHFHGLDIEMANLTVSQPTVKVLKVEIHHGLNVERRLNRPETDYDIKKGKLLGAEQRVYVPKPDSRHCLDNLDSDYKPYLVAVTCLLESPMKLYVQNQNYSAVLFGSTDEEMTKNVVRFETNMRWFDLFKILPVENKPQHKWKITDFNNVLNENPYFREF